MIKYSFDSKEQIMYVNFSGTVSFEELLDHVSPKENRQNYPKRLKILTNSARAKIDIKPTELKLIKAQLLETIKSFDKVYDAFVVEGPFETALSMMYMDVGKNRKYEFKVFSSLEGAMAWLKQQ